MNEIITKIDVGEFLKINLKKIVSVLTLITCFIIFGYCIYIFYTVAIQNKDLASNNLINTQKEINLNKDILENIDEYKTLKTSTRLKIEKLKDPFR